MKIKKINGFSLVELLIIIGLMSIIVIGLYGNYRKKTTAAKITLQTQYLTNITDKLNSVFFTSLNFATLNNTSAISLNAIPAQLIINPTSIRNVFNGQINIYPSPIPVLGNNVYIVQLTDLSAEECSKVVLSSFGSKILAVNVNGVAVKTPGTDFTPANITSVTTSCASTANNNIEFSTYPFTGSLVGALSTAPVIPKAGNTIPTIGNIVSSNLGTCTGGSVANSSYCACPSGQIWTGSTCKIINSDSESCQYGMGWSGTTCIALPATAATMLRYGTPPVGVNPTTLSPTIVGAVSAPTAAFSGTRYVESAPIAPLQEVNSQPTQVNCTVSGGNWDGRVCNYCPKASIVLVKNSDGSVVPLNPQATYSSWDGYRCVTPTTW